MQREAMQPWTQESWPDERENYLAILQGLVRELETAMKSIAMQKIIPFQESIRLQQAACSRLAQLQHSRTSKLLRKDRSSEETGCDSDLSLQIEEAIAAVLLINQQYAALLKHSGETLRLFAGLLQSYRGLKQSASGLQANLMTWSCEV